MYVHKVFFGSVGESSFWAYASFTFGGAEAFGLRRKTRFSSLVFSQDEKFVIVSSVRR